MNLDLIITFLFFGTFIANLVHWRFRKGEHLFLYSRKGRLFKFEWAWVVLVMGLHTAFLAGWMSSLPRFIVSSGGLIFWMTYSIWDRQLKRSTNP